MDKYRSLFREEDSTDHEKSKKVIADLIDMKNVDTEDEQGKFMSLIKGLVFADNPAADKFLKAINDFTSSLKKEDFE